jgi:hypothetical protein
MDKKSPQDPIKEISLSRTVIGLDLNPIKGSPKKMLAEFSTWLVIKWVGVALAFHVLVIVGLALAYPTPPADQPAPAQAAPVASATPGQPGKDDATGAEPDANKLMADHGNSAVVKAATETRPAPKEGPHSTGVGGLDAD